MKYKNIPKPTRTKLQIDALIFGNAFCWKKADGSFERIDPTKVKLNPKTKEFELIQPKEVLR